MIKDASAKQKKLVSIIIKADVHGSKDAIEQSLKKMNSDLVEIKIIHTGVGEVNESDVTLATASDALIFGFNVKANVQAKNCLLYTSPSPRDATLSRMPSSA